MLIEFVRNVYNAAQLVEEIKASVGARWVGALLRPGGGVVTLTDGDDLSAVIQAAADAHNPDALTADQQAIKDALAAWRGGALINRTPAEIYTLLQGQIDGWATLADARADLRAWLPLMGTALWYLMRKEEGA